ncbi:transcriptional regulator [Roseivirga sp. 4D4]|uniref:ArsR/SmtB family transcription factor n=1 Tax=Roseivirga sp. 4D4 TaxID=1889784 RepID=UPI000853B8E5|nr:metalloregulator ArsR/SmtB family transcription factor [Roseivirga sp. 4D4]OEK03063.1 transcriptional regulator [Roseivirga sp. 4D4]
MSERCIRVLADPVQIKDCKARIEEIQTPISEIAKILNLSGNEVRLKILYLLDSEEKMCPCDLSDVLGMSVPAISQHLRKLKDGGLVIDNKVGQTVFYQLVDHSISILKPILTLLSCQITKEVQDEK